MGDKEAKEQQTCTDHSTAPRAGGGTLLRQDQLILDNRHWARWSRQPQLHTPWFWQRHSDVTGRPHHSSDTTRSQDGCASRRTGPSLWPPDAKIPTKKRKLST